jgi:hypothetical protein
MLSFSSLVAGLPKPENKSGDRQAVNLLFLRGNVEIGFGQPIPIDEEYRTRLEARGFKISVARDFNPLSLDYLKQFNTVVWINPTPYNAGSRYFGPDSWQGGTHLWTVKKNAEILQEYVKLGGGLLINLGIEEIGMPVAKSHNTLLAPYKIKTACAQVRDKKHEIEFDRVGKRYPIHMSWTESILKHPATVGVKRIYYPAYTMRWDDNVTTLPLYPEAKSWKVLVKGMPSATASWYRGTPYETGHWKDVENRPVPGIVAVRNYKHGRVGVIGICHFHLFYYPFSAKKRHAECYFGPQNGNLMTNGYEGIPSDLERLLDNLYAWLAAPGARRGLGAAAPQVTLAPIPKQPVPNVAEVWADMDPMTTGPVRPQKILIGAHSACSDGQGSVAEFAAAGKQAGYDIIAFTENYARTTDAKFAEFVEDCRKYSDKDIRLLPGIEIEDQYDNRFLVLAKDSAVRAHLRAESEAATPGRKLLWTGHLLIGMGEVLPAASRPQALADRKRPNGHLPHEFYSHCPGVPLATYRNGKPVDDGLPAYQWQAFNASVPIPLAVHEVFSPAEIARAATTGLQSYVNSDTPEHAAFYFRQGHMSMGGNPMRYYVSAGPAFDAIGLDDWQSPNWTLSIKAHAQAPITDCVVYDQRGVYRAFKPNSTQIDLTCSGGVGAQRWFLVKLTDARGNVAWSSPVRTLPERAFVRCMDRQNWFSGLNFKCLTYTGRMRGLPKTGVTLDFPGATELTIPAPMLQLRYIGPGIVVSDYGFNKTILPGADEPKMDSAPIFNVVDNAAYTGNLRHYFFPRGGRTGYTPELIHGILDVELKQDIAVEAGKIKRHESGIWPIVARIGYVKRGVEYSYPEAATGQEIVRKIEPGESVDLPPGGMIRDFMTLTPLRLSPQGILGFADSPDNRRRGRQLHAEYLIVAPKLASAARREMGFLGDERGFSLNLSQGHRSAGTTNEPHRLSCEYLAEAQNYGMAGEVTFQDAPKWWTPFRAMPLWLSGCNPNWPVGLWRANLAQIQQYGIFEKMARGKLDITQKGPFYFGNLVTASNPDIKIAFAAAWTDTHARLDVHNPTNHPITCEIRSPQAISTKIRITKKVTLAAGQSTIVPIGE